MHHTGNMCRNSIGMKLASENIMRPFIFAPACCTKGLLPMFWPVCQSPQVMEGGRNVCLQACERWLSTSPFNWALLTLYSTHLSFATHERPLPPQCLLFVQSCLVSFQNADTKRSSDLIPLRLHCKTQFPPRLKVFWGILILAAPVLRTTHTTNTLTHTDRSPTQIMGFASRFPSVLLVAHIGTWSASRVWQRVTVSHSATRFTGLLLTSRPIAVDAFGKNKIFHSDQE